MGLPADARKFSGAGLSELQPSLDPRQLRWNLAAPVFGPKIKESDVIIALLFYTSAFKKSVDNQ